jgi:hypothetical protein
MSTVKYDNELRDKINDMQSVPDNFVFNPAAKWQEIENRLTNNMPKPKIAWWYWAAASIVLFVSSLVWLSNSKPTNSFTKLNTSKVSFTNSTKSTNQILSQFKQHKTATAKAKIAASKANLVNNLAPKEDNISIENTANTAIQPTTNITVDSATTAATNTSVVSKALIIKPKRKVIHISELVAGIPEPEVITKRDDKHIAPQEEQTTPTETNKSWWLFKPKPTTVNTFTNTSLTDNQ